MIAKQLNETHFLAHTPSSKTDNLNKVNFENIQPISEKGELMQSDYKKSSLYAHDNNNNLYQSNNFTNF
jgi:hypothetical protein